MDAFENFRLMLDESSSKILELTRDRPMNATELSEVLGIPMAATYRRIRMLRSAGMLREEYKALSSGGKSVSLYRSTVESAEAGLEAARIDLGYTRVVAPTDGIVGKSEVSVGNLVGRGGATLLTTISQVDPIHLRFSVSERDYLRFANRRKEALERYLAEGASAEAAREALRSDEAPFEMILADGSTHPHRGRLVFADRLVDPTTGTLLMEVAFANPDKIVRPGQYGRARVAVDVLKGAILVPQKAVSELQGLRTVYVLGEGNRIESRPVRMGPRVGTLWAVESGLAPSDKVVVEGIQKIGPGIAVRPIVVPIEG